MEGKFKKKNLIVQKELTYKSEDNGTRVSLLRSGLVVELIGQGTRHSVILKERRDISRVYR